MKVVVLIQSAVRWQNSHSKNAQAIAIGFRPARGLGVCHQPAFVNSGRNLRSRQTISSQRSAAIISGFLISWDKKNPPWKKEDPHQVRSAQSQWWWAGSWRLGRGEVAQLLHRAHQGTSCFQKFVRLFQCPWLLVFWGFVSCGKLGPVIRLRSCWKQWG